MYDCQSLTKPYKYLSFIGPPDTSTGIYQTYLVSSEDTPQDVSIDVIKASKINNVNPGDIYNEPIFYYNVIVTDSGINSYDNIIFYTLKNWYGEMALPFFTTSVDF